MRIGLLGGLLVFGFVPPVSADESKLRDEAAAALKKVITYYRQQVARHGGYVYYYSLDLQQSWGEGRAGPDTVFVQPPGTPTVGMAYLSAYEATGDAEYRAAAREAADCLVYGQLESGGWTQTIHFAPANRMGRYRNGKGGNWNASSLDDDQTQSALVMLLRMDRALKFQDQKIHEATEYGLRSLLAAQFPNGAFPQVWTKPVESQPIVPARYPDYDWKTEGRVKNYWDYYTLNDHLAGSVSRVLIEAHQITRDDRYQQSLNKLGDFLLLAQMPDPQPGWCQQYSYAMRPIWARKFEPPAITGSESQDVMQTLLRIAEYTGEAKYLEPIPRALKYFEHSLLPDGNLARYYELKTNKPLYMSKNYLLTYDDTDVPDHYGWKTSARLDKIAAEYDRVKARRPAAPPKPVSEQDVRRILEELDTEGRWISTYKGERLVGQPKFSEGFQYLSSDVFSRNVTTLSQFLAKR